MTSVMARKPLQPLLSLLKGILILPTLDSFGMACQSYIFPCGEGIDNFTEFVQSRVSVIRARCNGRLFARITGSLMQPQFTHRVLGIRSWTLPLESHQFCMSRPPQRAHNMVDSPSYPSLFSLRLTPGSKF